MQIMKQLAASGTSIVFITHKLREVRAVADDITVIRRGAVVGTASPTSSETELATKMVGRPVMLQLEKNPPQLGEVGLAFNDVSLVHSNGTKLLDHVSFELQRGEVLAIAGVQGNGQTELAEAILGLVQPDRGTITLDGHEIQGRQVRKNIDAGIGFIPEDRSKDGMIASFSIAENLVLDQYLNKPFASGLAMHPAAVAKNAEEKVAEFDIRITRITDPISTLSGGNAQVVVARELSRELRLLVASQPTRGVDVGSIEFIHKRIVEARDASTPVLLVSSELDEVVTLADRIAVMYRGKIVGIVPADTSRDVLGLMMAGVPQDEAFAQVGNATPMKGAK